MFSNIGTLINTALFGKKIGEDEFGNFYYLNNNKRWVIYFKNNDASSVPPDWQAWLTYTLNDIPNKKNITKHKWQDNHQPNLTGIDYMFQSSNKVKKKEKNIYSSWSPKK